MLKVILKDGYEEVDSSKIPKLINILSKESEIILSKDSANYIDLHSFIKTLTSSLEIVVNIETTDLNDIVSILLADTPNVASIRLIITEELIENPLLPSLVKLYDTISKKISMAALPIMYLSMPLKPDHLNYYNYIYEKFSKIDRLVGIILISSPPYDTKLENDMKNNYSQYIKIEREPYITLFPDGRREICP
jgi:hypothetical protein